MADISNFNAVSGSDLPGRSLPYSQEAEEAVIGCVLLDPVECREKAMEMLNQDGRHGHSQHEPLSAAGG